MTPRARRIALGIGVLVLVQALAITVYFAVQQRRSEPSALFVVEAVSPRPAPALSFERIDGSASSLEAFRGKLVLVHFWATWCVPCRDELPGLVSTMSALSDRGVELLAVAIEDDWATIRKFLSGVVSRSFVRPAEPDVHRVFGASTLPDSYLVDRAGNVIARYAGARDWTSNEAREHLELMIARHGS